MIPIAHFGAIAKIKKLNIAQLNLTMVGLKAHSLLLLHGYQARESSGNGNEDLSKISKLIYLKGLL